MEDGAPNANPNGGSNLTKWVMIIVAMIIIIVIIIFSIGLMSTSGTTCFIDPPKTVSAESLDEGKVRFSWDEVKGADS